VPASLPCINIGVRIELTIFLRGLFHCYRRRVPSPYFPLVFKKKILRLILALLLVTGYSLFRPRQLLFNSYNGLLTSLFFFFFCFWSQFKSLIFSPLPYFSFRLIQSRPKVILYFLRTSSQFLHAVPSTNHFS